MSQSRKLIAISDDVLMEALKVSEKIGIPLREFIDRVLRSAIDIMKLKPGLFNVMEFASIVDDLRKVGISLVPYKVLEELLDRVDEESYRRVLQDFYSSARWFALLTKIKKTSDPLSSLVWALSLWFSSVSIDVVKASDQENVYRVIVFIPRVSNRMVELVKEISTAIAYVLDLDVRKVEASEGVIALEVGISVES